MNTFKKYRVVLFIILAVIMIAAVSVVFYFMQLFQSLQNLNDIDMADMTNPNISDEVQEVMEGYWTIALFGVDSRDGNIGKGSHSDVEMICNINRKTGEIRLVSVYRDTYLKIDQKDNYNKINQAYFNGGPSLAISALSENLDLYFDDYAAFNWKAVADCINLLGGVEIEISEEEFYYINSFITETVESTGVYSSHLKHAGVNHMDGVQAVAYARLRKSDTDFKRTERQRIVISKVMEKAKHAEWSVINNILVTVLPQILTSVGVDDLIPMAKNLNRYHLGDSSGFPFKLENQMIDSKDCVIPVTLESNVVTLHKFLFDDMTYQPSKQVKEISTKIEVAADKAKNKKRETKVRPSKPVTETIQDESAAQESSQTETAAETVPQTEKESVEIGPGVSRPTVPKPVPSQPAAETEPLPPAESSPAESTAEESTQPVTSTESPTSASEPDLIEQQPSEPAAEQTMMPEMPIPEPSE